MQALPFISAAMTIFQAVGQIQQGKDAQEGYAMDAAFTKAQGDAQAAQTKASAANDALDRARKIRQAIGNTLVTAAGAGVSVGSGSVGRLVEDSQSQYSRDIGLIDFNTQQTIKSIKAGAKADAAALNYKGAMAYKAGVYGAIGTIGSFAMDTYERGSVPSVGKSTGGAEPYGPFR